MNLQQPYTKMMMMVMMTALYGLRKEPISVALCEKVSERKSQLYIVEEPARYVSVEKELKKKKKKTKNKSRERAIAHS